MTTTTLRPNGTVSFTGSVTGAGSAHAALSDSSDSSYTLAASADTGVYDLGTFTLGTAVTKSARLFYRGRSNSSEASTIAGAVSLNIGSVAVAAGPLGTSFDVRSSTVVPVSWSQAEIDSLRATANGPAGTPSVRLSEIYVDVVHVAQPVVDVVAVTDPFTAATQVPVGWSNTLDADGGAQTRYEVKVFAEDDYPSFTGLDPDTDTPFYETGNVLSGATSTVVGPLLNGDTYRAYVRVAQTVNGAAHWSGWDYDEFTMDVDTSDVATVTATPDDANARILVTVNRDTGSEAWQFIEVQRSVDAGVSWLPVRSATFVDCTGDAAEFEVYDYETGNGQDVLYRARATYLDSGLPITGAWVQSTPAAAWESDVCWLKSPTNPGLNMVVKLKVMISPTRRRQQGVFDIVGSGVPVVVSDVLTARTGIIELFGLIGDDSPLPLLSEGVLLLHAPPSWYLDDLFFAPGQVTELRGAHMVDARHYWQVDFVEVAAPADPLVGL